MEYVTETDISYAPTWIYNCTEFESILDQDDFYQALETTKYIYFKYVRS